MKEHLERTRCDVCGYWEIVRTASEEKREDGPGVVVDRRGRVPVEVDDAAAVPEPLNWRDVHAWIGRQRKDPKNLSAQALVCSEACAASFLRTFAGRAELTIDPPAVVVPATELEAAASLFVPPGDRVIANGLVDDEAGLDESEFVRVLQNLHATLAEKHGRVFVARIRVAHAFGFLKPDIARVKELPWDGLAKLIKNRDYYADIRRATLSAPKEGARFVRLHRVAKVFLDFGLDDTIRALMASPNESTLSVPDGAFLAAADALDESEGNT